MVMKRCCHITTLAWLLMEKLAVNLMVPATEGTVKQLMDAWWNVKVRLSQD